MDFAYEWNHIIQGFCVWVLHVAWCCSGPSVCCGQAVFPFVDIPHLLIHSTVMATRAVSTLGLPQMMVLWTQAHRFCVDMFFFLSGIHLWEELLCQLATRYLMSWQSPFWSDFTISHSDQQRMRGLISPQPYRPGPTVYQPPWWTEVESHCALIWTSLVTNTEPSVFLCACGLFVYLPGKLSIQILCTTFNWVTYLLIDF